MESNTWYTVSKQSLALYARHAGFDLSVYNEYSPAVQQELRRRAVNEAMRAIELAFDEHKFSLRTIKNGVYVITIANPLAIQYPSGQSQVLYIGRGDIYKRIKSHFERKLFEFMLSVGGAEFDFHFAKPARSGTPKYFEYIEQKMLEWFSDQHGENENQKCWPLLNRIAGAQKNYKDDSTDWWKYPLRGTNKKPLWAMKPTKHNDFAL